MANMFLVIADCHCKWLEVRIVNSVTSSSTIQQLRSLFTTHGILDMIVTNNGTTFTNNKFQQFTYSRGVRSYLPLIMQIVW